jgi:hypothetical protein
MPNRLTVRLQPFVIALALCLPAWAQVATWECTQAELPIKASPAAALDYLKGDRRNLSSSCVIQANGILGTDGHYKPAIDTLVGYLDFKVPLQPGRPIMVLAGVTSGFYPAADALDRMDKLALPAVERALANDNLPAQARVNAAKVFFDLRFHDRPQEAIGLIVLAAHNAKDVDTQDALQKVAKELVRICPDNAREKCQEALDAPGN